MMRKLICRILGHIMAYTGTPYFAYVCQRCGHTVPSIAGRLVADIEEAYQR